MKLCINIQLKHQEFNSRMNLMAYYTKHVFICTNQRDNEKKCCQQANASEILDYAKSRVKELGLSDNQQVRINKAGCLGRCALGPTMVIYPEGIWYTYRDKADIDEIIESHLMNDKIVNRLLMSNTFS